MINQQMMSLGDLTDPKQYVSPLELSDSDEHELSKYLEKMLEIRFAEQCIARNVKLGNIKTPCHLGIGQEAIAVGIASQLMNTDRVFGGHRSHSQFLALGGSVTRMFSEVLGRKRGASKGMGGSMHLYDGEVGFHGSVPIVAGTISISVGAALAAKMDGGSDVAVCFFGDGAAEEGVLHESLNLAASMKLPVLFVCENNLFSSHLDIEIRQPGNRVARFADAHGVAAISVDGNDVLAVRSAAESMIDKMRSEKQPGFLEAITFRHLGHVGPNEDIDVGVHRSMDEVNAWKLRDPIKRMADAMISSGMLSETEYSNLRKSISNRIEKAYQKAELEEYPEPSQLTSFIYSKDVR